jgi:hypothetical protein
MSALIKIRFDLDDCADRTGSARDREGGDPESIGVSSPAAGDVPIAAPVEATVAVATGEAIGTAATTLAGGVMRAVLMNKLKLRIISLLAVGALAGIAPGFAANRPGRVGPAAGSAERPAAQAGGAAPPAAQEGRITDTRPAVARVLPVAEGIVNSVAFGPEGRIAAGYDGRGSGGGVVVFDARGERLLRRPVVEQGNVTGVAFGPEGRIAAGYGTSARGDGGVVVFDAP